MNSKIRIHNNEQLDNLSLSGKVLQKTLSSLKLINSLFGNHKQLNRAVLHYCKTHPKKNGFRIIDLGCGGGDCMISLSKKLHKHQIKATFTGIDGNSESIAHANRQNQQPECIRFITANILQEEFILPDCDLLISSHFIYHFKDDSLTTFLNTLQLKETKHLIFSELYRSKVAYYLFRLSSYILPISEIAKKDGLLAIQRAFTARELKTIIQNSLITDFKISKRPWFRMIVTINL